ncbi:MAG: N-acetylmuramoyl-L-alanine amidase [Saprospiraceae bacterium]|nr:N-acetylmuramoyl-L-alanine amidase [Saprospiraceae bacterium]
MFKSIFDAIKQLFSVLFPPTVAPPTKPEEEQEWRDASDLPQDTVVVTEDLSFEVQPGIIIPDPVEDKPIPTTTTEPTTTSTTTTTTTIPVPKASVGNRYMWCLDNGHAKETPGKRSVPFKLDGVTVQFFEYEFNRDIVKRMLASLKEKGIKTYNLVPEEIEDISLAERVRRANTLSSSLPKLYISIHSNAATPAPGSDWVAPTISGMETWYYQSSTKGKNMAGIFQKHLVEATAWKIEDLNLQNYANFMC